MIKRISILVMCILMLINIDVYAEEDLIVTVDEALKISTDSLDKQDAIDEKIDKLWDAYYQAKSRKEQFELTLENLENYEELYDKKYKLNETLSLEEQTELEGYMKKYGDEPPYYTNQDILEEFIIPGELLQTSIYAEISKLRNELDMIENQVSINTMMQYNQLLSIYDSVDLSEELLRISHESLLENTLKWTLGEISEYEFNIMKFEDSISVMEHEVLLNKQENTEMIMTSLISDSVMIDIEYVDYLNGIEDIYNVSPNHQELEDYLSSGLSNRVEIKKAQIDLEVKQNEFEVVTSYLSNELLSLWVDADIQLEEAVHIYDTSLINVQEDITNNYLMMLSSWNKYLDATENYHLTISDYEEALLNYDLGEIVQLDMDIVESKLLMYENQVRLALRDYKFQLLKLNISSCMSMIEL